MDNAPKVKEKKNLDEASLLTSSERNLIAESSRSPALVEALAPAPTPSMTGLTRSSKVVQPVLLASPVMSSGIVQSP